MKKEYYTNVTIKFGKLCYRGYEIDENETRKRVSGKLNYKPTLYLESETETEFHSLYKKPLKEKKFDSISAARQFVKDYADVMPIYGYAPNRFEYDFLANSFPDVLEIGIDDICVGTIDIETTVEHGRMDVINVPEEILLITYQNLKSKKLITFGSRPSNVSNYVLCKDESDVISKFIRYINEDDPDIITGWNSDGFDIPYVINRGYKIIGEDKTNQLSPFGIIEMREKDIMGKFIQVFTIVGRATLDMLELYKKFTFVKRENNKLETICHVELGVGKLENPYGTFREFYSGVCDVKDKPDNDAHVLRKKAYERTMMKQELIRRGLI